MGDPDVSTSTDPQRQRVFVKALLDDVNALEQMLERDDVWDVGVRRIGAEQEMFLVDAGMGPAPIATELLERIGDPRLTTELARFNLEANLTPLVFGGGCLSELHREIDEVLALTRRAAAQFDAKVVLTGILPTLTQDHLGLDNMTPIPRYHALNAAMKRLRGGAFRVQIKGVDELETQHDNVMLESCNTSFQIHFQVAPGEFAKLYNVAQAVTAPVLAVAANSPLLLGRRLWHETRVALFQHSVDARSSSMQARGQRPRVSFGDRWIDKSVLEIFREDIALFRTVFADAPSLPAGDELAAGRIPDLAALRLHNGTVYRWNRPCYGVVGDRAHLRIENRVLPAGPTVIDEIANAAFYFGLMAEVTEVIGDPSAVMDFDHAKGNFLAAARHGLAAQFNWIGGTTVTAARLVLDELLPMARAGLVRAGIDGEDIDKYLGVIAARVEAERTGSQWALKSLAGMEANAAPRDVRPRQLVAAMVEHQCDGDRPVHTWPLATYREEDDWKEAFRTVGQFMTTQIITVRPEDLVDLAASMMDWVKIRHVPVEDDDGRLVGLVSHRALLRMVARGHLSSSDPKEVAVADVMRRDPVTVTPQTPTLVAMRLMRDKAVGALPVIDADGQLVGIVTERDLIEVSARLLERHLAED
jgi:CBS domain-containing protein/gamma-glutamylcysteine synthetase